MVQNAQAFNVTYGVLIGGGREVEYIHDIRLFLKKPFEALKKMLKTWIR